MTITFVNRFTLTGTPEDFERAFTETAEFICRQPGLMWYTLSCDVRDPSRYVNIAQWDNAQSLRDVTAHPDFPGHAESLRALSTSEGAVYAERLTFAVAAAG